MNNAGTITGRHGIATDGSNAGPSTFTVNNVAGGLIAALNGSGLNIDGPNATVTATVFNDFGGTFKGGVLAGATSGDGDGIDVDGVLTLTNQGDILGLGARGAGNNARRYRSRRRHDHQYRDGSHHRQLARWPMRPTARTATRVTAS